MGSAAHLTNFIIIRIEVLVKAGMSLILCSQHFSVTVNHHINEYSI